MCRGIITLQRLSVSQLLKEEREKQRGKERKYTYSWYEAVIWWGVIRRFKSIIGIKKQLINRAKKINPWLQFSLRVISLSFCRDKCYELSFWCDKMSVRTTEKIPAQTYSMDKINNNSFWRKILKLTYLNFPP